MESNAFLFHLHEVRFDEIIMEIFEERQNLVLKVDVTVPTLSALHRL